MSRYILISLLLLITAGQLVQAQNTPPVVKQPHHSRIDEQGNKLLPPLLYQDETPEQRKARLGTAEDPGLNPDPETKWLRFGKLYTIQKFPRIHSTYDQDRGFVRPLWYVNVAKEVYDETEEFVWVWMNETEIMDQDPSLEQDPSSEDAPSPYIKYSPEGLKYVLQVKEEFSTIRPARTDRIVRFRESSQGLPVDGSWRNGLDVADMNNDGLMDLIIPPQRGGIQGMFPFIFLGDGKGGWKVWREVQWSTSLNYGSVAAGDLNGDGNQDLVFGVHLQGVVALLGDGKGNFTSASEGLPRNDFPTRRVVLRDMDNDKDLDIVVITEGATMSSQSASRAPLRVYRNEGGAKSWKLDPVAEDARQVAGDWLSVGDFNGDKRQDIAGASVIFHGTDLIYLGEKNNQWKPFGRGWLPFYSYYGPSAAVKVSSTRRDDLILTFSRVWPAGANPSEIPPPEFQRVIGIERVVFDGKEPRRVPVARWEGRKPVGALATGDFDGDRNHDIIYWDSGTRGAVILLGDGKGGFKEAAIEGMTFPKNTLYDIKVADVNADRKPDVLVMFESGGGVKRDGSVRVFLNESGTDSARAEKKVATRN